ncbi:baseplate wedge subunit [Acinetobacter phage ZZ1]|uniref:Baseplate wedge protein gp10 n=1 Tax=Acinetobacter phage ZZ1 TaxID=1049283 RepID=W5ZSA9_9CAUD|nr:baseplate wedge subunit [Acinetobacter phage ZZ1]AHI44676.1 baseplate wedge subunit and tail pin protein [Acinetobacter phage ZZ1]
MKENLKIGNVVDDGTGDYLREGGIKINNNFNDLYGELGDGSNPHPAGAWQTIKSSASNILAAKFGKSYAIDTNAARVTVNLPKGTVNDYNKVIRLRDTFGTWQANSVTVVPASGDTLKGSSDSQVFATNLTDLELVYCAPGRWEFLANKLLNKISNGDIATVMKKEFLCTEGQTDFINIFGDADFNLVNTHVYHRGNLLYYGAKFSADSDYGSPGTGNTIVPLDGKSIRLRQPARKGDSLMIVTYVDGIAQWRSTYNRLDIQLLDQKLTDLKSVNGAQLVTDLATLNTITPEQMGYTLTSNSGLINPSTFEVYLNGVILNMAGKAGTPLFICDGAKADNQSDCVALGGVWKLSNTDYAYTLNDNGAIESIEFGRTFEHGDILTIKWFNNDIGTTLEMDDIINEADKHYIQHGTTFNLNGNIRITDFDKPQWPNIEAVGQEKRLVQTPIDLFELVYPVGTIYENAVNPNNPATYMGFGVWKLWGQKQVLFGWTNDQQDTQFGLNNNDIDANGNPTATAGGTGGVRAITLENNDLPATVTTEKALVADDNGNIIIGGCQFDPDDGGPAYNKYREDVLKTNPTHTPPNSIDILPPYITVYRWMRIA